MKALFRMINASDVSLSGFRPETDRPFLHAKNVYGLTLTDIITSSTLSPFEIETCKRVVAKNNRDVKFTNGFMEYNIPEEVKFTFSLSQSCLLVRRNLYGRKQ